MQKAANANTKQHATVPKTAIAATIATNLKVNINAAVATLAPTASASNQQKAPFQRMPRAIFNRCLNIFMFLQKHRRIARIVVIIASIALLVSSLLPLMYSL